MAEDWLADVLKYDANANPDIVAGIVRYCGIALRKRDSSLVSFTSPDELGRVRDNFLRKKLGRPEGDSVLNDAIAAVGQVMKADRTKNRVTVYYLLAREFDQLHLFERSSASKRADGEAVQAAAAESPDEHESKVVDISAGAAALAAGGAAVAAPALAAAKSSDSISGQDNSPAADRSRASYAGGTTIGSTGTGRPADLPEGRAPKWWLWLLLALAAVVLVLFLRGCSHDLRAPAGGTAAGSSAVAANENPAATADAAAPAAESATAAQTDAPNGAGVVSETRDGLPALKIYFDVGKSAVSADLANASQAVRAYLHAHPNAHLVVSGYNDPTGNAAANAALSKSRAQNVAAALEKAGVAASAITLEKPADSTSSITGAESRRVEVAVRS
jgi:outer membrane protein OmpA-like peptidoglycan-associated protein